MSRRVVITGMGVITPLGNTLDSLFAALVAGQSGVGPITHFDARTFPTNFAAEVKDFDIAKYTRDPADWEFCGANSLFSVAASRDALADAGLLTGGDRSRFGVYLGTGEGTQDFPALTDILIRSYIPEKRDVSSSQFVKVGLKRYHPRREYEQELQAPTARLANEFGLEGPNFGCLTACAAGSQAIGEAVEMIRHGDADVILAGGSHSMIHPFGVTGFNLLTALSTNTANPKGASRPFDLHRDGFVLGEGSGMVVLEDLEHAKKRGAKIHAELTGYGSTADAYRVTDSHPDGRGAASCMRLALEDARLNPADVGYINAHGTSTHVNDRGESIAIKHLFGERAYKTPVSSTKSMMGHLIGAAGAVELIIGILAIQRGVLPPTINYETPDPECDLDYIPNVAREAKVDHVLSNSFGFGGQNVALAVSRFR